MLIFFVLMENNETAKFLFPWEDNFLLSFHYNGRNLEALKEFDLCKTLVHEFYELSHCNGEGLLERW